MSRTLVVGPAWIGDMVMAQSLFMTLRELDAEGEVDVLAPPWTVPLLARMPEVSEPHALPAGHGELALGRRLALARKVRRVGYDRAIVLPRSIKSALVPWLAGIPRRTGYLGETRYGLLNDIRPLDEATLPRTVDRYVALAYPRGFAAAGMKVPPPRLMVDRSNQDRLLKGLGLSKDRRAIALVPGAEYGPAKRWPAAAFAELARTLVDRGDEIWLLGSTKDAEVCGEIVRLAGGNGVRDLSGRTSLADVVDLIAAADQVVTNDTGLMHVAAATGRPVVAIFGSTSPGNTPPLSAGALVHYLGIDCSPCYRRVCPFGHYRCLREIGVEAVLHSIRS